VDVICDISKTHKTFIFTVKRLSKKNHEEMYLFSGNVAMRICEWTCCYRSTHHYQMNTSLPNEHIITVQHIITECTHTTKWTHRYQSTHHYRMKTSLPNEHIITEWTHHYRSTHHYRMHTHYRMNTSLPFNTSLPNEHVATEWTHHHRSTHQELNPNNTVAHNRTDHFYKPNAGSTQNVTPYKPLQQTYISDKWLSMCWHWTGCSWGVPGIPWGLSVPMIPNLLHLVVHCESSPKLRT